MQITGQFLVAKDWRDVDVRQFKARWPNFHPSEFASDDFSLKLHVEFMDKLQRIRTRAGFPFWITSGYRTKAHNRRVGGGKRSQHMFGRAGDIALRRASDGPLLERVAREEGMTGIGRYPGKLFIHVDNRVLPRGRKHIAVWGRW